jgi:hypothetical protein
MYSNYILYFIVLVILFLLIINKINFLNEKESFNNGFNGNIVVLNKLIKNINNKIANNDSSTLLMKLITLDTIDI